MANRIKALPYAALALCLSIACSTGSVSAQSVGGSAFQQIAAYATAFQSLGSEYSAHLSARSLMLKERDEVRAGLVDTQKDLQAVTAQEVLSQLQGLENEMDLEAIMQNAKSMQSATLTQRTQNARAYQSLATQTATNLLTQLSLRNQALQLDAAAALTLERQQKLLISAQDLVHRARAWIVEDRKLDSQYIELADVAGTRSQLERRAALRELERADLENAGAGVARAITLMRLERVDDARKLVEDLLQRPSATLPFVLAVSGELSARAGEKIAAKKALNEAIRLAPDVPELRWFRAQSLVVMNEAERALTDWEWLLKTGQQDIAAHRGLALTCCSISPSIPRYQKVALQHAQLANSLAGGSDWSCQIALALATARSGDLIEAATLAESAAQNAMAEQKAYCLAVAEQLQAGNVPGWKF